MLFEFNLYSTLLLIFFVHILVYSGMLMWRGIRQGFLADRLLSCFLFLAAFAVAPWMLGFAGWYDEPTGFYKEILFYAPFVHGLYFGPLLFLYVQSLTNFGFSIKGQRWLHFLPGTLYLIWTLIVVVTDKLIAHDYLLMNGRTDPDFDSWYQWLSMISVVYYLNQTIRYYKQYKQFSYLEFSFAEMASMGWLRYFLIAFGIITIMPFVEKLLTLIPFFQDLRYVGGWYYYLGFVIVVYYIAINGYNAVRVPLRHLTFEPRQLENIRQTFLLDPIPVAETIPSNSTEQTEIQDWKEKIKGLLIESPFYTDPELTLTQLARKLDTNTSVLSKVINQGYGMNFNDFINSLRVEEVVRMLRRKEHLTQTYLGIAFECGFNSKATFNRAFKKHTGQSPRDWLQHENL